MTKQQLQRVINVSFDIHNTPFSTTPDLIFWCFSGGSDDKESACNVGDPGLIPELGRSPEVGNGNPLQYSCLENPMDRGAWQAIVQGVARNQTQLSPCISTSNVIIP